MMERITATPINRPVQMAIGDKLRMLVAAPGVAVILFFMAHLMLGWSIVRFSWVATIHLGIVFLLGIYWALINPRLDRLAVVAGYIVGAEVLWRMSKASPFWEFGKYSLLLLFGLALLRTGRLRGPMSAFLYFGCLLPSIVLPMANVDPRMFRDDLSFYLSGPLALMVSIWFFSHVKLQGESLQRVYYALIGPAITLATVTLIGIMSTEKLRFSNNSNVMTSGGFGPNQVSAALGLGILATFLAYQHRGLKPMVKIWLLGITLFLTVQCAMTFSRSGIYMAAGGIIVASFFLIRDRRFFVQLVIGISILLLTINFFLLPRLEKMTGGLIKDRFTDTRLTGRDRLAEADWLAFSENPIFGVGPGQARVYRQRLFDNSAAHTEFSRLLAEHGIFGLIAIFLLILMGIQHFLQKKSLTGKALSASMVCWSFLFMMVSAMRLAAPAFAFGLTAALILPDKEEKLPRHE